MKQNLSKHGYDICICTLSLIFNTILANIICDSWNEHLILFNVLLIVGTLFVVIATATNYDKATSIAYNISHRTMMICEDANYIDNNKYMAYYKQIAKYVIYVDAMFVGVGFLSFALMFIEELQFVSYIGLFQLLFVCYWITYKISKHNMDILSDKVD